MEEFGLLVIPKKSVLKTLSKLLMSYEKLPNNTSPKYASQLTSVLLFGKGPKEHTFLLPWTL